MTPSRTILCACASLTEPKLTCSEVIPFYAFYNQRMAGQKLIKFGMDVMP
jgi:hypothetical protein